MTSPVAPITMRPGYADDAVALLRLAALDSAASAPPSPLLVAEVDGDIRAALSLRDGSTIANPFFPTADILALLRMHAAVMSSSPRRLGRQRARHGFRYALGH